MSSPRQTENASARLLLGLRIFEHFLRLVRAFIVIPLVSPGDLGLYRFTTTLMGYLPLFHGGFFTTLLFQLPRATTVDEKDRLRRLLSICALASILGSCLGSLFLLTAIRIAGIEITSFWLVIAALGLFILPANLISNYLTASGNFLLIAKIGVGASLLGFIATVIGSYLAGTRGLILASALPTFYTFFVGYRHVFRQKLCLPKISEILAYTNTSIAFFVSSSVTNLCRTGDVIAIGYLVGPGSLTAGLYAFGTMIGGIVDSVVSGVGQVYALTILRSGDCAPAELSEMLRNLTARDSLLSVMLSGMVIFTLSIGIPAFLPKYSPALPFLSMFLFAVIALRWRAYGAVVLNAASMTRQINKSAIFALLVTTVYISIVHLYLSDSLIAYSYCSAITYFVDSFAVQYYALRHLNRIGDFRKFQYDLYRSHAPLLLWLITPLFGDLMVPLLAISGILAPALCLVTFRRYFPASTEDVLAVFKR
jgi:O-antigen/teichoic acid export membrane protein